jgi:hypothetical protein
MIAEAQVTTRNAGLLVVQRGAQVASGFLFAMLIPRLMGAETYGQYALVTSLALWFVLASNLGFTQVIARYVPEFMLSDDKPGMQAFFGGLLTVRLTSGVLAAALLLLLTALWLRELDRLALAFVAGVVRAASHLFFALFLGLNQAARWGMEAVVRGWVSLTVLLLALSSVGRLLALVYDQPGVALTAEGARLAAFWTVGPVLVAWQGDFGGCLAVLAASILYAVYFTWRMMCTVHYSLRMWFLVIALGGLFLPLTWLPSMLNASSLLVSVGLYATFLIGYGGILFLLRIVTPAEIAAAWRAISQRVQAAY